jgi:hypothetical protein
VIPAHDALLFNVTQMRVRAWFLCIDLVHTVASGAQGELGARTSQLIQELNQGWPHIVEQMRAVDAVLTHVGAPLPPAPRTPVDAMNWSADVGDKLDAVLGAPQYALARYCCWLGRGIGMARATLNVAVATYHLLPADPQKSELLHRVESLRSMRGDHDQWLASAEATTGLPDGIVDTVQYARNAFAEPWQQDGHADHGSVEAAFQQAVHRLDAAVTVLCEQLK